jgi:hypothetical protein
MYMILFIDVEFSFDSHFLLIVSPTIEVFLSVRVRCNNYKFVSISDKAASKVLVYVEYNLYILLLLFPLLIFS